MKDKLSFVLLLLPLIFVLSCSQGDVGPTGPTGEDAAVLQFQSGNYPSDAYTGVTDCYLEGGWAADTNYGTSDYFFIGRYKSGMHNGEERALLKFDLSELQNQHIKIKKADIILYCYMLRPSSTTITVTPYEVNKYWEETETTWNNSEAGITWVTAGGDYSTTPVGNSLYIDKSGEYKIFSINPSVVQKWIDNPQNNFGLIFISDTENINENRWAGFYSTDNSTVSYRPKLVIYYTLN